MFVEDRESSRRFFAESWRKHRERAPLQPVEAMIAEVVALHPEYHTFVTNGDAAVNEEFTPERGETNPFLHMGMHLALREQVRTDRPPGIAVLYHQALARTGDAHAVEHEMMECLGEALWSAERNKRLPDEDAYLECLRRRLQ